MKKILLVSLCTVFTSYILLGQCGSSGGIVISEIMYNPTIGVDAEFEFIEILNSSDINIELEGLQICEIEGGNLDCVTLPEFTLGPGETYLLERGTSNDYGSNLVYGGDIVLNNGGEAISVRTGDGTILFEVSYSTNSTWNNGICQGGTASGSANGGGESLQLVDPCGAQSDPTNWVACDPTPNALNGLPIELSYFNVKEINQSKVELSWATVSEINNEYFSIEHSTDSRNFESIDIVAGALNSTVMQYYNYIHKNAVIGNNYYRLRQVDTDGTFSFSPIEVVRLQSDVEVEVRPTLAESEVTISVGDAQNEDVNIEVIDILGRTVIAQTLGRGELQVELSVADLQKGHYFVRIQNGVKASIARFIKR